MRSKSLESRVCPLCRLTFEPRYVHSKYCSRRCQYLGHEAKRLEIPEHAADSWFRLMRILVDLQDAGERVPCQQQPDRWWSDEPAEQHAAIAACMPCPALKPCGVYAQLAHEPGVWGGSHRRERTGRAPRARRRPAA